MARILYAVQGDGLGHATRAHSVGSGLLDRGHEVHFISSLKGSLYLREHFPDAVTDIFGFKLAYDQGRIQRLKTFTDIARGVIRHVRPTVRQLRRLFRERQPDLLITDGEWFAPAVAKLLCVPFVSLDNQHVLTHCRIERPPGSARDFLDAYAVVRLYHTGARRYFVSSFFDVPIRHHPTTLVPPILREKVYAHEATRGDYLLVYLGGSGAHDEMREVIESYTDMPIRAYGFGATGRTGRVTYKPMSADGFLTDLAGCAGVVASAGHTLIGESLYFDKPMLLVPFGRQFEQRINAHYVKRIGVGDYLERLSTGAIRDFTDRLDEYRAALSHLAKPALAPVLDGIERELS